MVPFAYACKYAILATITVKKAKLPDIPGENKNAATFTGYDTFIEHLNA